MSQVDVDDPLSFLNAFKLLSKPSAERFRDRLISALQRLQGNRIYRGNFSEDDRNTYVADNLESSGESVKDQTRWSVSHLGKDSGEIDIYVTEPDGTPYSIIEAMNLEYIDSRYIKIHLEKIFNYDTAGHPNNYIVVYSNSPNFSSFCDRYLDFIKEFNYEFDCKSIKDAELEDSEIEHYVAKHSRNGNEVRLNHIILNLAD